MLIEPAGEIDSKSGAARFLTLRAACGCPARYALVELPTKWFEATYSIQLSYGCVRVGII
jgi:hypothetical protein